MEQNQLPPLIIPGFVVKKPISHTAMVLYGLIFSLQREEGYAFASNAYYANELGLSVASIKRYIKELVDARLILVHLDRKSTDLVQRKIFLYSAMTAFRAYEEEGGQLKSEPYIQDTTRSSSTSSTSSTSRLSREDLQQVIDPIYKAYPRKIGKNLAIDRLFQKHFKFEDIEKLGVAVMNYSSYCKKNNLEAKYILQFSTFVGRWRDWFEFESANPVTSIKITSVDELQALFAPKTWDGTKDENQKD